jgi:hypothetical protein
MYNCGILEAHATHVADKAILTRTADGYLAGNPQIAGVIVKTQTFPGFASVGAF